MQFRLNGNGTKFDSFVPNHNLVLVFNCFQFQFSYLFLVLGFSLLLFLDFEYSAKRHIFNSCLCVWKCFFLHYNTVLPCCIWKCGTTSSLVFDVLLTIFYTNHFYHCQISTNVPHTVTGAHRTAAT